MDDSEDKIKKIKEEIKKTPYHKGTEHHIGLLRAKLAKLEDEQGARQQTKGGGASFAVKKQGDATIVLLGFPSVGKSTLLNALTSAQAKVAPYVFTTVTVIPGMMEYRGAKLQILDVPGFVSGAASGKGHGREILSLVRSADLLLLMIDVNQPNQLEKIKKELELAGVRINKKRPAVFIKKLLADGLRIQLTGSKLNKKQVTEIAREFKLANAEILVKEDLEINDLIDGFSTQRIFLPAVTVVNKIDLLKQNFEKNQLSSDLILVSAQTEKGLEQLKEEIWRRLGLVRTYLKPEKRQPDFNQPLILKSGQTVLDAGLKIHGQLGQKIKRAKVWGKSAKFPGQTVSLSHQLADEDILTLVF